jgi:hypothetical protein
MDVLKWLIEKFLDNEMGIFHTQIVENRWVRHPFVKHKIDE